MVFIQKEWNGVVINNYEDYQKLSTNKKYKMPLIQTNNRLYIGLGALFFPVSKNLKVLIRLYINANILEQLQYHHTILHSLQENLKFFV